MSVQLGSIAIISGMNTTFDAPNSGAKGIVIGNESGLTCTIIMESGGVSKTLYPGVVDWFSIYPGFSGKIIIKPTSVLNNVSSWPASSLIFDAIGLNDSEDPSMYPISLNRNNNIGNSVSTVGGSTTSVTNDNQPLTPSNVFIESTPTNAPGSTISIATDGTVTIKGDVANVLTALLQLIPSAASGASSVKLADSTRTTEILGKLLVDGSSNFTGTMHADGGINANTIRDDTNGNTALDLSAGTGAVTLPQAVTVTGLLTANGSVETGAVKENTGGSTILSSAGVNTHVACPTGDQIIFNTGAAQVASIDATNGVASQGTNGFTFPSGGFLPNLSFFTGAATGTYNHSFGASPFWVCPMTQTSGSQTMGYDTVTSSQVHITSFSGLSFKAACM